MRSAGTSSVMRCRRFWRRSTGSLARMRVAPRRSAWPGTAKAGCWRSTARRSIRGYGRRAVSGYFQAREEVWKEPVYRDVWGLLHEFGDAEIASLIAPRALIVEASRGPQVDGPPPPPASARALLQTGASTTPPLESVRSEVERAHGFLASLKSADRIRLVVSGDGRGLPGSDAALQALLESLDRESRNPASGNRSQGPAEWLRSLRAPAPPVPGTGGFHSNAGAALAGGAGEVLVDSRCIVARALEGKHAISSRLHLE